MGGAARGLDRATSRVQLLEITWRGDFFVWIESLSGSDASLRFLRLFDFAGRSKRVDVTMKQPNL